MGLQGVVLQGWAFLQCHTTIGIQSSLPPLPLPFEELLELAAMHCLLAQRQSKGLPKLECVVRE